MRKTLLALVVASFGAAVIFHSGSSSTPVVSLSVKSAHAQSVPSVNLNTPINWTASPAQQATRSRPRTLTGLRI